MGDKKYIILRRGSQIVSLLLHGNRLQSVHVQEEKEGGILGNIYVARVKNVVKNLNAAFVEIKPGENCFLDLRDARKPVLLNRDYDGRLLAEDEIIVQVYKEAMKTKPPAVTCKLSLDGKYCVVTAGKAGIAYSAKLPGKIKERLGERLEHSDFPVNRFSETYGIVIRTNAKELKEDLSPLTEEIEELSGRLGDILQNGVHRTCYSVLLRKTAGYLRKLRDLRADWCDEIITDEKDIYEEVRNFMEENPDFGLPPLRLYADERLPLAKLYAAETRLKEVLDKKVWLKSGGYLLIEPTEALTVIDVNTGKTVSRKEAPENHFRTNMEAAEEIARQLSLRNLSGIIIIDFIDMENEEYRNSLTAHFGRLLKQDAVKTALVDITALGLAEVTRMKTSRPLRELLSVKGGDYAQQKPAQEKEGH